MYTTFIFVALSIWLGSACTSLVQVDLTDFLVIIYLMLYFLVPCNDNLDDDLNDPEFDFLNEEENIEDDPEESRNDRAVQIPSEQ